MGTVPVSAVSDCNRSARAHRTHLGVWSCLVLLDLAPRVVGSHFSNATIMSQDRVRLLTHVVYQQFGTAVGVSSEIQLKSDQTSFQSNKSSRAIDRLYFCSVDLQAEHGNGPTWTMRCESVMAQLFSAFWCASGDIGM